MTTTRRNFLKNTALTTAAITIPGTAIASVDNWAKMEPKYYSPIHVPGDWELPQSVEDINRINLINQFDVPYLCNDIIQGSPIIIPEKYYIDDMQFASKSKDIQFASKSKDIQIMSKKKSYACISRKYPHNGCSFKENCNSSEFLAVYVPTYVIAVKEKNTYIAFEKIEKFIRQEINSYFNDKRMFWNTIGENKQNQDYVKLLISQTFGKYDMKYKRDLEYEQDGVQSIDHMVENHKSEFYAMRIGIVGFNADKTIS